MERSSQLDATLCIGHMWRRRTAQGAYFLPRILRRGLDFPGVDWVIQADCPEDVATHVHREVGRRRFEKVGVIITT